MTGFPWGSISRAHAGELIAAEARSAREDATWAAEHEPLHPAVVAQRAEHYREVMGLQHAEAARAAALAQQAEEQQLAQRSADLEDYQAALLASGRQPRTVSEVLRGLGGMVSYYPVDPP